MQRLITAVETRWDRGKEKLSGCRLISLQARSRRTVKILCQICATRGYRLRTATTHAITPCRTRPSRTACPLRKGGLETMSLLIEFNDSTKLIRRQVVDWNLTDLELRGFYPILKIGFLRGITKQVFFQMYRQTTPFKYRPESPQPSVEEESACC